GIPPFDSSQCAGLNCGIPILLQPLDAEIFDKMSNGAVIKADLSQLTQHPVVVENGNTTIRLVSTSRFEWWYFHSSTIAGFKWDLNGIWDGIWDLKWNLGLGWDYG